MTARHDRAEALATELREVARELRDGMNELRRDMAERYIDRHDLKGITDAWSQTIAAVESRMVDMVAGVKAEVENVHRDVEKIEGWGTWAARILVGTLIVALLALVGLSTGPSW